jgi:hypothetical protein
MRRECKLSLHFSQLVDGEVAIRHIRKNVLYDEIIRSFVYSCKLNNNDPNYISFINKEYLLFMIKKYNGCIIRYKRKSILMNENCYNEFMQLQNDFKNNHKLLELACFYYFNIMPPELR